MDVRSLYARVKHLPPEAALWRAQEQEGETNGTVSRSSGSERIDLSDPGLADRWFAEEMSG